MEGRLCRGVLDPDDLGTDQNSISIRELMDSHRVSTYLRDLPCAELPEDYVFVASDNLARSVQNTVAPEMIFPTN